MTLRKVTMLYSKTGGVTVSEEYFLNGLRHRNPEEGPACIYRREKNGDISAEHGQIAEERYYQNGRLHRENGPAVVRYDWDGVTAIEEWYYRHGKMHRDPKRGPARIERYDAAANGGVVLIEGYYVNGRPFRDPSDGPDYLERRADGSVEEAQYSNPPSAKRPAHRRVNSSNRKGPTA
jgi:hypothetical protein